MTDNRQSRQQLTGKQRRDLHAALSDAFRPNDLIQLLRNLGVDYNQIVPIGAGQNDALDHIVRFAAVSEQPQALLTGALEMNATNKRLRQFADGLPTGFLAAPIDENALLKSAEAYRSLPPLQPEADWHAQLEPYLKWVARQTGGLRLAPLDKSGKERNAYGLTHLYIDLDTTSIRIVSEDDEQVIGFTSAVLLHIDKNSRQILLGDPGSGKTTLLRYLTNCLAMSRLEPDVTWLKRLSWDVAGMPDEDQEFDPNYKQEIWRFYWSHGELLPVYVELRNFVRTPFEATDGQAIWRHVEEILISEGLDEAVPALKREVQAGRALFLFDGVDEVPPEQRAAVWQAIFAHEQGSCGGNRWVATCRHYSFDASELPQANIPVQTLQPLNERQIATFIDNWFTAAAEAGDMSATEAQSKAVALKTATQRKHLRELADNPMLLTIMALVQTYHGTLPEERAMLYQACIETLMLRWQQTKEPDGDDFLTRLDVTPLVLEQLLWEIGWTAHRGAAGRDEKADIPENEVMKLAADHLGSYGKAEQFVQYTEQRAHLLVGRGGRRERVYTFPHRTFQEYLAACHLARPRRWGHAARQLAEEGDAWREMLNLAAGTLTFNQKIPDKALDGIDRVAPRRVPEPDDEADWRRIWLAAEMLTVVGVEQAVRDKEVGRKLVPHVRDLVTQLVATGRLTPQQRMAAGEALARLGDERPGVCALEPDMIPIADESTFLMGDGKRSVTVPQPYAIARYPVTNAQFGYFMDDGGYTEKWRHCWTVDGWQSKQREEWTQPLYWDEPRFNLSNQPVVGVSWYEAAAYATWLAATTGKPYRLPTELEWERAARHTDGRTYPWGETWRDGIVNSREASLDQTTTVGMFPDGAAECDAQDMSGNVWEWANDASGQFSSLRGGSWATSDDFCRAASRLGTFPNARSPGLGFRLVVRRPPSHPDH